MESSFGAGYFISLFPISFEGGRIQDPPTMLSYLLLKVLLLTGEKKKCLRKRTWKIIIEYVRVYFPLMLMPYL